MEMFGLLRSKSGVAESCSHKGKVRKLIET